MKNTTKKQREEQQKAALRQRLTDLAFGANCGNDIDTEMVDVGLWGSMSPEAYCGYIKAAKRTFEGIVPENRKTSFEWLFDITAIHKWDSIAESADRLWELGVRA